jgi:hypothetical protein
MQFSWQGLTCRQTDLGACLADYLAENRLELFEVIATSAHTVLQQIAFARVAVVKLP